MSAIAACLTWMFPAKWTGTLIICEDEERLTISVMFSKAVSPLIVTAALPSRNVMEVGANVSPFVSVSGVAQMMYASPVGLVPLDQLASLLRSLSAAPVQ